MLRHSRNNRIFTSGRISEVFSKTIIEIQRTVEHESENYILNVNENQYIDHLVQKYRLEPPIILFDDCYADSYEADIPAEWFPMTFHVREGEKYKRQIIQYFIPVSGQISLMNYSPASSITLGGGGGNFQIQGEALVTEIINLYNDPAKIKAEYENEVRGLNRNYDTLLKDIEDFNLRLEPTIKQFFATRKKNVLSKNEVMSALGVPLKKRDTSASTFSVPRPQIREKISIKPVVHALGFSPEPSLNDKDYHDILKMINDVGKNFERMPGIYKGKGEEELRDHILMILDPNFQLGSASGETFNSSGKTDILLRYDSSVVFIAECKFWSGEKKYLETISQLLGYLTWRDTKASVIVFVKQKDISNILSKIEEVTSTHSNYVSYNSKTDDNWFNYRFHINGDSNREVKLAVQIYHLPKMEK
ncbi:MAG: hypothetical protein KA278_01610 [Flavobacterium sp.]|nr:hypothetical protein [Flavobacterium sp.]